MQVRLRMRRDEHQKLQREAEKRGQTINAEALRRLAASYETEGLIGLMTAGSKANQDLLDQIARCLYVLRDWEKPGNEAKRKDVEEAVSLITRGFIKGSITGSDVGKQRDEPGDRGRLVASSVFNRTVGRE
jgi:hypothetical protein